jgi:hypothetical protein
MYVVICEYYNVRGQDKSSGEGVISDTPDLATLISSPQLLESGEDSFDQVSWWAVNLPTEGT